MNMRFELERGIKSHAPNLQSKEMPSSPPTPPFDSLYLFVLSSFFIYFKDKKNHSKTNLNYLSEKNIPKTSLPI